MVSFFANSTLNKISRECPLEEVQIEGSKLNSTLYYMKAEITRKVGKKAVLD